MYIEDTNANINIDGKEYNITLPEDNLNDESTIKGLKIISKNRENKLNITIKNTTESPIVISKLEIHIAHLDITGYSNLITNPEYPNMDININQMSQIKEGKFNNSHLFSIITGRDEYPSILCGFLSNHSSRNYINIFKKGESLELYAVFDFISHRLLSGDTLKLDCLYKEYGKNYFELLNRYALNLSKINLEENHSYDNYKEQDIFFSIKPNNQSVKDKGKYIFIKQKGKRLYVNDISNPEFKNSLIVKLKDEISSGYQNIFLKNFKAFIDLILKTKSFNAYYEISVLLSMIKNEFPSLNLIFEDCPEGLAINYMDFFNKHYSFRSKGIIRKLTTPKKELQYDFIIRTILQKGMFNKVSSFDVKNKKIKQAMELVSLSTSSKNNENILEVIEDIDREAPVLVNLSKNDIFSILRFGKKYLYISVFNFSKVSRRFYWDLSLFTKTSIPDGVAVDILTNSNYLIADGKIDIKHIPSMDCCMIKKTINNNPLSKEI